MVKMTQYTGEFINMCHFPLKKIKLRTAKKYTLKIFV